MTRYSNRRILVTDGEQRASLAIVRSLGAAGHIVHICAGRPGSLAAASRFAKAEHVVTNALNLPGEFSDEIQGIIAQNDIDTVFPVTESALLALLPRREQLPNVLFPFADAEAFSAISDKQSILEVARRSGIATPDQITVSTPDDVNALDWSALKFPIVVKPARSVSTGAVDRLKTVVQHAASVAELRAVLAGTDQRAYPLLLQQRICGDGIGIFVLVWNGELIAEFAHRRIREKPPSGGISVYRESIPVDPALLRASLCMLAEFKWQGVAMVEFKLDAATGIPYLMEINGRFWGSLQLAIDSGVDFPALLLQAASGRRPPPVKTFHTHVRSRWFWGDVDHVLTRMLHSDRHLAMPPDAPSRLSAIRDFLQRHPDDVSEIFRKDDPKPFQRESVQWLKQLLR